MHGIAAPMKLDLARVPPKVLWPITAVVALILVWRIIVTGANALTAGEDPTASLPAGDAQAAAAFWRKRVAQDPTDYYALLLLGAQLEALGQRTEAADAFGHALRLAPSDRRVLLESAGFYLRSGDMKRGLAVLRRTVDLYPAAGEQVWPIFMATLVSGAHQEFFLQAARDDPKWWEAFFQYACANTTDVRPLQAVFTARADAQQIQPQERACFLGRLQREGRWVEAYQMWLNSLPPEQKRFVGNVFNGGFEYPISGIGFDWIVPAQEGVRVDTHAMEGASGKRALRVQFVEKRFGGTPIFQYLMVPPGRYRFEGMGRPEGLETWLGLQWGLYCVAGGKDGPQLARTERFLGSDDWRTWRQELVVPAGCPVQLVRLELANPNRESNTPGNVAARMRGAVVFDDIKVVALD